MGSMTGSQAGDRKAWSGACINFSLRASAMAASGKHVILYYRYDCGRSPV